MTQKEAGALLYMPASTLSEQQHRSVARHRQGHRIRGRRVMGIDQISYHKRRKYATLVYDLERSMEAIDEVRKEHWREATREARTRLKGLRWLLYRHSSTRSRREPRTLRRRRSTTDGSTGRGG